MIAIVVGWQNIGKKADVSSISVPSGSVFENERMYFFIVHVSLCMRYYNVPDAPMDGVRRAI